LVTPGQKRLEYLLGGLLAVEGGQAGERSVSGCQTSQAEIELGAVQPLAGER
jgi:hypothetical protein